MYRLAKLSASQLNDIQKLEAKWKGVVVLATKRHLNRRLSPRNS
jgi:hypothetical protein